jgi:hypothetical protein
MLRRGKIRSSRERMSVYRKKFDGVTISPVVASWSVDQK